MGLDMYLEKAKRINGATVNEIRAAEEYYSWLLRPRKYVDCTMNSWCGFDESDVNMSVVDDYRSQYHTTYCAWDTEKRYGTLGIFDGVGYWRKANAIHAWFVENVQDGIDDCHMYEVTKEQLEELLSTCTFVKESGKTEIAKKLLPTTSGFFFGNTEYDDNYWEDLDYTIDTLRKTISSTDFENEMIVYSSSW